MPLSTTAFLAYWTSETSTTTPKTVQSEDWTVHLADTASELVEDSRTDTTTRRHSRGDSFSDVDDVEMEMDDFSLSRSLSSLVVVAVLILKLF